MRREPYTGPVLPEVAPDRFEGRGGLPAVPGWGPLKFWPASSLQLDGFRGYPVPDLLAATLHHVPLLAVYPTADLNSALTDRAWGLHAPVDVIPLARRIGYALGRAFHEQTSFGAVALEFLARSGVPVERLLLIDRMDPPPSDPPREVNQLWWAGLASVLSPRVAATLLYGPLSALLLRLERNDLA